MCRKSSLVGICLSLFDAPFTPCSRKEPISWCYMSVLSSKKPRETQDPYKHWGQVPPAHSHQHTHSVKVGRRGASSIAPRPPPTPLLSPFRYCFSYPVETRRAGWQRRHTGKWVRYSKGNALRCRAAHASGGQGDRAEALATRNPQGHIT